MFEIIQKKKKIILKLASALSSVISFHTISMTSVSVYK